MKHQPDPTTIKPGLRRAVPPAPRAAEKPEVESGRKVCGVLVVVGDEFPCLLEDQHEGFCEYGRRSE